MPRPMSQKDSAQAEFLARRYLASRGAAPMVDDPLQIALPRLRQEVTAACRLARLDLTLAVGLTIAALTVVVTAWLAPVHGGILVALLHLHLAPLVGLGVAIWAAIVMERSGPRLLTARRIAQALSAGSVMEAFDLAVTRLPATGAA